jgi:polysaccharide export outer membrane protein
MPLATLNARRLLWLCLGLWLSVLAGCAFSPAYPPAPALDTSKAEAYKIGALDTLNIVVWRNTDLSSTVTVRPDGRISIPLVDDMPASGKTPTDLGHDIERALAKFIREPSVSVVVSNFKGAPTEQVRIVGEATKPQAIAYRESMTLLDVMIQSGGLTDFADGNRAVLVRATVPPTQYSLRLKDLLKRGDISANIQIKPGDIIIVPQSPF